jgi:hypothetical protein
MNLDNFTPSYLNTLLYDPMLGYEFMRAAH